MTNPAFWNDGWTAAVVNHLWQSTIVAAFAWLLVLILRKNTARARYWVWMVASVKFLLPFSLLMTAGEWLRSLIAAPVAAEPVLANVMEQVAQPFSQAQLFGSANFPIPTHHSTLLPIALVAAWICGALVIAIRFVSGWWKVNAAKRAALPLALAAGVPVLCSPSPVEPGIFGIFRPVLLLPQGILERLTPEQLRTIVVHEMCHVRRRDNLTFEFHMFVETLLWFYPPVWWIGARLIEEREIACDEAVLLAGEDSQDYAEGILNVCKFYVESPLECVAGVTGADLKMRIVRILSSRLAIKMGVGRKLLLGAAAMLLVAAPVAEGLAGALSQATVAAAQTGDAATQLPAFEVASVKPNKSGEGMMTGMGATADGTSCMNVTLQEIFRRTFGMQGARIIGAPGWVKTDRFNIEAKVAASDAPKLKGLKPDQRWLMLLPVLEDRFNLKFHHESRELPTYALVIAKGGLKLKEARPGDTYPNGFKGPGGATGMFLDRGKLTGQGVNIAGLINMLVLQGMDRAIFDKTGLTGKYDFTLQWTPDNAPPAMAGAPEGGPPGSEGAPQPDAGGPSLLTALEEQLGLKLEPQKERLDVIVVDHIEKPSEN
jgi:bla regulator protein blaR1